MRKLSADFIHTVSGPVLTNHIIVLDDENTIVSIDPADTHDANVVERFTGHIIPGLVNTHCHLELSHMKGKGHTGTGLIPFIQSVVSIRDFPGEEILQAIQDGDQEMYDNGIVAVGDISNKIDTAEVKQNSKIHYYTFVEAFDFLDPKEAQTTFDSYKEVFDQLSTQGISNKSMVPHAPYSVSPLLFDRINALNAGQTKTISIHNQETIHETQFFIDKTGDLLDFYKGFGLPLDQFTPTGNDSIYYAMQHMDPNHRTLFVHNTMSKKEDILQAYQWNPDTYFCTCPNANLYIENRLPDYRLFIDAGATMTIGTDSLTSNWQLSILEEMKTIQKYQSAIDFEQLLKWATLNGAKSLGMADTIGSIEIAKTPGLNLLSTNGPTKEVDLQSTRIRRLV